ncbi:MAG: metal-dependent transcriptional regulator [Myxococcota bacterium]
MSTVRYLTDVSLENYVKAIYHLGRDGERVKTKALAAHLNVSLPSVTGMLRSLADDGLVDYTPYKGVRLTERGQTIAVRVIRHHRLVETFLVEVLGYSWDEVHDEAEVLEHAVSQKLAAAIERHLGYPTVDPHGDPIPPAEGEFEPAVGDALLDVPAGESTTVSRIHDQSPKFLRYLETLGLTPGARVEVLERMPFDGPVRLRCGDQEATLSRAQLSRIEVQVIGSGVRS